MANVLRSDTLKVENLLADSRFVAVSYLALTLPLRKLRNIAAALARLRAFEWVYEGPYEGFQIPHDGIFSEAVRQTAKNLYDAFSDFRIFCLLSSYI